MNVKSLINYLEKLDQDSPVIYNIWTIDSVFSLLNEIEEENGHNKWNNIKAFLKKIKNIQSDMPISHVSEQELSSNLISSFLNRGDFVDRFNELASDLDTMLFDEFDNYLVELNVLDDIQKNILDERVIFTLLKDIANLEDLSKKFPALTTMLKLVNDDYIHKFSEFVIMNLTVEYFSNFNSKNTNEILDFCEEYAKKQISNLLSLQGDGHFEFMN